VALGLTVEEDGVALAVTLERAGFMRRWLPTKQLENIESMTQNDRSFAFALADLRCLSNEDPTQLNIDVNSLWMSHHLVASVDAATADVIGLPPLVDLTLRTDAEGLIGSSTFRLKYEWFKDGKRQLPVRKGAILQTAYGLRRLPLWLMNAIAVADEFEPGKTDIAHWEALARFRQALDPGVQLSSNDAAAKISMTDFLSGLEVRLVDRFSISVNENGTDFDVLPFSAERIQSLGLDAEAGDVTEAVGELTGKDLQTFQQRVRDRGALAAYRLGSGSYVVVDNSVTPVLETMVNAQRGSPTEREAFIRNPRARITDAVEQALRRSGALDGLEADAEEALIEAAAGPAFIETAEFSQRVVGIKRFEKQKADRAESGTTWMPEGFETLLAEKLTLLSTEALIAARHDVSEAISAGAPTVSVAEVTVPAIPAALDIIERHISERNEDVAIAEESSFQRAPMVFDVKENFEELHWQARLEPRKSAMPFELPDTILTKMKAHQLESLAWQQEAWSSGISGVLNADEQGLGKTLQTIAFLVWLKTHMASPAAAHRGPVLVVAPTSLLENWEQEVAQHVARPGLGHLIRLYGSSVGARKVAGARGRDTDDGEAKLDLDSIHEAIEEGRAHRFWVLTTYTTLTNYQHSLGRIAFSAAVFDEIQALKNPYCLRAVAARAMNADFRIGLTGTPIENSAVDLWAINEQLNPGALGILRDFKKLYGSADAQNMAELHGRMFNAGNERPAFALRRLKETVAKDLPVKLRYLHPRLMPEVQATAYEGARLKLAEGGPAAALKALHHIRAVSVHPGVDGVQDDEAFITSSSRLHATMDLLRSIQSRGERVLVFIEHVKMQYRFIELVKAQLGIARIDLIHGQTPIPKRQAIVNRFQRHLSDDGGFDMLVLGPKAAGTGLTLTAATNVIHLSRWWNPAVEEQCNDRVHRLGQTKPVAIHVPMAIHPLYREQSFDCLLQSLMARKRKLANSALWPMGDTDDDVSNLQRLMSNEASAQKDDPLHSAMASMFDRDGSGVPKPRSDGSYLFS
jgi:hypothetical protein